MSRAPLGRPPLWVCLVAGLACVASYTAGGAGRVPVVQEIVHVPMACDEVYRDGRCPPGSLPTIKAEPLLTEDGPQTLDKIRQVVREELERLPRGRPATSGRMPDAQRP